MEKKAYIKMEILNAIDAMNQEMEKSAAWENARFARNIATGSLAGASIFGGGELAHQALTVPQATMEQAVISPNYGTNVTGKKIPGMVTVSREAYPGFESFKQKILTEQPILKDVSKAQANKVLASTIFKNLPENVGNALLQNKALEKVYNKGLLGGLMGSVGGLGVAAAGSKRNLARALTRLLLRK